MNYSITQSGNLAAAIGLIAMILHHFRFNIAEDELMALAGGIITIVGILTSWYGRYRKGDLKLSGFRK